MVAYADLILPDTTYLERFDCICLLDRPISDADGAADAIRQPVVDPATRADGPRRARLPGGAARPRRAAGPAGLGRRRRLRRSTATMPTTSSTTSARRASARWPAGAARTATQTGKGEPNPDQLSATSRTAASGATSCRRGARYFKMANRGYLDWAQRFGFVASAEPIVLQLYSEPLQKFRLAAQGHGAIAAAGQHRERVATYFDPLPFWYAPFEDEQTSRGRLPAARGDPAADGHVPFLGLAERLAAADHHAATGCTCIRDTGARARPRRRGLGRGHLASRQIKRAGEDRRQRATRHGLDLERHRQAQRRLGAGDGRAGGDQGLPAEPPDLRMLPPEGRSAPTPIRSPGRRPGSTCASSIRKSGRGRRQPRRSSNARPWPPRPTTSRCVTAPASRNREHASKTAPGTTTHDQPAAHREEEARPRHRPRHLRRLPGLRDRLQGMEHRRLSPAPLTDQRPLRRGADGVWFNRVHSYEVERDGATGTAAHRAFPALLPALRDAGLRHRLPDRRLLQARRGRHRAGQRGHLHRLQAVRLGLPLRRARDGRRSTA